MTGFSVDVARNGEGALLTAHGELDLAASEAAASDLQEVEDSGVGTIVVDLADVGFIDSSGLRVLLEAAERARGLGRRFVVARPSGQVGKVLDMTGSDSLLEIAQGLPSEFAKP